MSVKFSRAFNVRKIKPKMTHCLVILIRWIPAFAGMTMSMQPL